jgi:hypothetical protein
VAPKNVSRRPPGPGQQWHPAGSLWTCSLWSEQSSYRDPASSSSSDGASGASWTFRTLIALSDQPVARNGSLLRLVHIGDDPTHDEGGEAELRNRATGARSGDVGLGELVHGPCQQRAYVLSGVMSVVPLRAGESPDDCKEWDQSIKFCFLSPAGLIAPEHTWG